MCPDPTGAMVALQGSFKPLGLYFVVVIVGSVSEGASYT